MKIIVAEIRPTGLEIKGREPEELLNLKEEHTKNLSDLFYDLTIKKKGAELIITGNISADFLLTCVRCMIEIPYKSEIKNTNIIVEINNRDEITLDNYLRDEILFQLPAYPKCTQYNLENKNNKTSCREFPDAKDFF